MRGLGGRFAYAQPLGRQDSAFAYRYPLSAGAAAPAGKVAFVLQVYTEHGFRDLHSPSHPVEWHAGSESAPCPPQARCGSRGVPSHRSRVVRFTGGREALGRDFELVYTPAEPAG